MAMEANLDKVRKVQLYDTKLAGELMKGLSLSPWQPNVAFDEGIEEELDKKSKDFEAMLKNLQVSSKMTCSFCQCTFDTRSQQKDHYKLDWHRFNLKQSMIGASTVTEEKFETMTDDISSISGSDTSDDERDTKSTPNKKQELTASPNSKDKNKNESKKVKGQWEGKARGHPRIFYRNSQNQLVSVFRCILQGKQEGLLSQAELVQRATNLPIGLKWAVLMTAAGHFAAAIFYGSEVVVHKTFHRYTVRAKRGTAQSVRDNQKGSAPKSAGATLRRYNEAQLYKNIHDVLKAWEEQLESCQLIFIRAPSYNRALFFGGKHPLLSMSDSRIRSIPFPTKRPTLREVQRVRDVLASVECYGDADKAEKKFLRVHKKDDLIGRQEDTQEEKLDVNESTAVIDHPSPSKINHQEEPEIGGVSEEDRDSFSGEEIELFMEDVVTFTAHLKESEVFPKRRKKKKKVASKEDFGPKDKFLRKIQNDILTSCRTGSKEDLENALSQLTGKFLGDCRNLASGGYVQKVEEVPHSDEKEFSNSGMGCRNECKGDDGRSEAHVRTTDVEIDSSGNIEGVYLPNENVYGEGRTCKLGTTKDEAKMCQSHIGNNVKTCIVPSATRDNAAEGAVKILTNKNIDEQLEGEQCLNSSHVHENMEEQGKAIQSNLDLNNQNSLPPDCSSTSDVDAVLSNKSCQKRISEFLNEKLDGESNTFLHIAAGAGKWAVLWILMENGADPSIKNKKGSPPYTCSSDKQTRNEFRHFMGVHADKYDYKTAQIPAPLTEDQEEERAAKATEKKKAQRKVKRNKQKEHKEELKRQEEEELRKQREEEERQQFAALSDREKRALAAEKRLQKQSPAVSSKIERCWQCGADISGKVPFQYYDFKMCSVQCLQLHRQKNS